MTNPNLPMSFKSIGEGVRHVVCTSRSELTGGEWGKRPRPCGWFPELVNCTPGGSTLSRMIWPLGIAGCGCLRLCPAQTVQMLYLEVSPKSGSPSRWLASLWASFKEMRSCIETDPFVSALAPVSAISVGSVASLSVCCFCPGPAPIHVFMELTRFHVSWWEGIWLWVKTNGTMLG